MPWTGWDPSCLRPCCPWSGCEGGPAHGRDESLAAVRRCRGRAGRPGATRLRTPAQVPDGRGTPRRGWPQRPRQRQPRPGDPWPADVIPRPRRATPAREDSLRRTDVRLVPRRSWCGPRPLRDTSLHPAALAALCLSPGGGLGSCCCSGHHPVADVANTGRQVAGRRGAAAGTAELPRNDGGGPAARRGSGRTAPPTPPGGTKVPWPPPPLRKRAVAVEVEIPGAPRRLRTPGRSGLADRWAVPAALIEMTVDIAPRAGAGQAAGHGWRRLGTCHARAADPYDRQTQAGRAGPGRSGRPLGKLCPAHTRRGRDLAAGASGAPRPLHRCRGAIRR